MIPYLSDADFTLYNGDAVEVLRELPAESVHCCLTSPPFFGLRDYGTGTWEGGDAGCDHTVEARPTRKFRNSRGEGIDDKYAGSNLTSWTYRDAMPRSCKCGARRVDRQIGLEATPEEWVASLVAVFDEVKRVLRKDGTLWVECGDSYAHGQPGGGSPFSNGRSDGRKSYERDNPQGREKLATLSPGLKPKDLIGQPFLLAQALRAPRYLGRIKNEHDRIWLAAMVEAEGCMFIHKRKAGQSNGQGYERKSDSYGAGLEVASTDRVVAERCMEITGLGSICEQGPNENHRRKQRIYRWNLRSNVCREIIAELYPYFIAKQHEARLLLGCPSSGVKAAEAHVSLKAIHQGGDATIDFKAPDPKALHAPGWYWRNTCIWHRPNPMPESVRDRFTVSHSYVLLLSKSPRYFFDAEAVREGAIRAGDVPGGNRKGVSEFNVNGGGWAGGEVPTARNARSVWTIPTEPLPFEHYAAFPQALAERCIKAGSAEGDTVLDCFGGSGTTALVARRLNRKAILVELNERYCELIARRTQQLSLEAEAVLTPTERAEAS